MIMLYFIYLFIYLCFIQFSYLKDVIHTNEISEFCRYNVGRVIFAGRCAGTCAVVSFKGRTLIITCRHVVYDEALKKIPLYAVSFAFNNSTVVYTSEDFTYVGSNSTFDVSIFVMKKKPTLSQGFKLSSSNCYQFQPIILTCFPQATDVDKIAHDSTKIYRGTVSAAENHYTEALTDITPMPNSSGGPVLSRSDHRMLLGIHMGVTYHENTTNKLSRPAPPRPSTRSYVLVTDDALIKPIKRRKSRSAQVTGRPDSPPDQSPGNTCKRSLYACDNVEHKGALAYFVTSGNLIALLEDGKEPLTRKVMGSF